MNTMVSRAGLCVSIIVLLISSASGASSRKALSYNFAPHETNAFKVEIESQTDAGSESVTGTLLIWAKPGTDGFQTLCYRVQFLPKGGVLRPMYQPGPYSQQVPLYSFLSTGIYPMSVREVTIDSHGSIVRAGNDQVLPAPLGTLFTAIFPELPAKASRNWEVQKSLFVMDEPFAMGPAQVFVGSSYGPGSFVRPFTPDRSGPAALLARYEVKFSIEKPEDQNSVIRATTMLKTVAEVENRPQISGSANARWVLDANSALPILAEWDCKSVHVTKHISRSVTLKLRAERLSGESLAKAIEPPAPPKQQDLEIKGEAAARLVEQLVSGDSSARMKAAQELYQKTVKGIDPASLDQLAELVDQSDSFVRRAVLKVIAANPRPSDLPLLLKSALEEDSMLRQEVIRGIGSLKTDRAATALADLLAMGASEQVYAGRNSDLVDALKRVGPVAEPAVLGVLKEKNIQTLVFACNSLESIGTEKSMEPLKELVTHQSKVVSEAAAAALRAIQGRTEK